MPLTWTTLEDLKKMPSHTLKERTYLDADGKATTSESKAVSLLGIEGDEITNEQAASAGLAKAAKEQEAPQPKMLYYDAAGKRVAEGSTDAAQQFLDNDPTRPDAPKQKDETATESDGLDGLKKDELIELAEAENVDLSEATTNAQRVAAIRQARG